MSQLQVVVDISIAYIVGRFFLRLFKVCSSLHFPTKIEIEIEIDGIASKTQVA